MSKDAGDGGDGRAGEQRRSRHDLGYQPTGRVAPDRAKAAFQPPPQPSEAAEPAAARQTTHKAATSAQARLWVPLSYQERAGPRQ